MSVCHVKSRQQVKGKHIWGVESVGAIKNELAGGLKNPEDCKFTVLIIFLFWFTSFNSGYSNIKKKINIIRSNPKT